MVVIGSLTFKEKKVHSKPKTASLSIAGKRLLYRIRDIEPSTNIHGQRCVKCNGTIAVIADTVQWGFFEDEYHYYTICEDCGKPTCFRQTVPTYTANTDERGA